TIHGLLTGNGNLVKSGAGTLSLFASNSYKGETLIKGGKIYLGSSEGIASGLGKGAVTLDNGTLSFLNGLNSYDDNRNNFIVPQGKTGNIELDGRCNYFGSLTGGGTLNLYTPFVRTELNGDWSKFSGSINVTSDADGGTFLIGNNKGLGMSSVTLANNVTMIYRQNENVTIEIGELAGTSGAILGAGGDGPANITWKIGGKNSHSVYNGTITDAQYSGSGATAAILKTGTGRMTLIGANTYSGGTVVEGGSLIVSNTSGSATGTGSVKVKSKTMITGNGIIAGPLIIEEGGGVSPGDANIGKLTVNNSITFHDKALLSIKCNTSNIQTDILKSTGQVTLGGILFITNLSDAGFASGIQFRCIEAPEINGVFSAIVPAIPGDNLVWDSSELNTKGIIKIAVSTGIKMIASNNDIQIFPNPVVSLLTVKSVVPFVQAEARLYDVPGRLCLQWNKLQGSSFALDLTALKKGIYCLLIFDDRKNYTAKVVKQ
ncbi:MAG: autotransporter-associated beta strand repeat-containing protein, partial [Bacteroidota bacterium]|nr:autotransporter-associated beta strand repeat-containing protein [Bacteroidota bacterium]